MRSLEYKQRCDEVLLTRGRPSQKDTIVTCSEDLEKLLTGSEEKWMNTTECLFLKRG